MCCWTRSSLISLALIGRRTPFPPRGSAAAGYPASESLGACGPGAYPKVTAEAPYHLADQRSDGFDHQALGFFPSGDDAGLLAEFANTGLCGPAAAAVPTQGVRGAAAMESWKKKRGGRERWKTLAQMHHAIKSFQVVLNKSAAHEEQNEPQPVRPKLGDLNMFVNDASGVTSDDVDAWGESDMDMFVKIEVQSKTAGVKSLKQATSTVTADGVRATWKEKLVLPVHDGTEELRVILCKNKKGGFNTGVVAAAAIYVQDILRAVPIDKHFQLFKPGEGGDAGFIRLAMNFRQQAMHVQYKTPTPEYSSPHQVTCATVSPLNPGIHG